jgi:ABC-type polysaccharide/polyol phosphate export permease
VDSPEPRPNDRRNRCQLWPSARAKPERVHPYLTAGLIIWSFLTTSIRREHAFVNAEGYIKQISLPIYVYVFRCSINVGLTTSSASPSSSSSVLYIGFRLVGDAVGVAAVSGLIAASPMSICILAHFHAFPRHRTDGSVGTQMAMYVTPIMFPAAGCCAAGAHDERMVAHTPA